MMEKFPQLTYCVNVDSVAAEVGVVHSGQGVINRDWRI
jgi:hypothetical protein